MGHWQGRHGPGGRAGRLEGRLWRSPRQAPHCLPATRPRPGPPAPRPLRRVPAHAREGAPRCSGLRPDLAARSPGEPGAEGTRQAPTGRPAPYLAARRAAAHPDKEGPLVRPVRLGHGALAVAASSRSHLRPRSPASGSPLPWPSQTCKPGRPRAKVGDGPPELHFRGAHAAARGGAAGARGARREL